MQNPYDFEYAVSRNGSVADALENEYPQLLEADPVLQLARLQVKTAEAAIRGRVRELARDSDFSEY